MRILAIWVLLTLLTPAFLHAEEVIKVPVRVGQHTDFTRLVFDFPRHIDAPLIRQGDNRALLRLPNGTHVEDLMHVPQGLRNLQRVHDGIELTFALGTRLRRMQLGDRVVIDILGKASRKIITALRADSKTTDPIKKHILPDAPSGHVQMVATHEAVLLPAPAEAPVVPVEAVAVEPVGGSAVSDQNNPVQPIAATVSLHSGGVPLLAIAAIPVLSNEDGSAMVVPFDKQAGAAAFRRGQYGLVVFDERQPIDLSALRADPLLGEARVVLLPTGTLLTIPLPSSMAINLARAEEGWRISVQQGQMPEHPFKLALASRMLSVETAGAGSVVNLVDPLSGATLLVGTERDAERGVDVTIQAPEYKLLRSWQGMVVLPLSDALTLRAMPGGYRLIGGREGLASSASSSLGQEMTDAAYLTSRFDFPAQSLPVLERRLRNRIDSAAAAPPLARGRPRRDVAKAMIAIGMGAEADGILRLAAAQDPQEAANLAHAALKAIADILAGRPALADGTPDALADRRLSGFDDIALWRALRTAMLTPGAPDAAAILGITAPLIGTWPAPMRDRVLPLAVETMIAGGEATAAARIVRARPNDRSLDFARGMLKQDDGDTKGALAIFDRLALSPDRKLHARAAVRAVNIRLAADLMKPGQAANALDRLIYAWRGGRQELALRRELAELRAQSGEWRIALALLRHTEQLFPDDRSEILADLHKIFGAMLQQDGADKMPPLDLVALLDDNADLLPSGTAGEALEAHLADRLLALDLPDRAEPLLDKLMSVAPTSGGRATFGARLAVLRLRLGDAMGARQALAASAAPDLRPKLARRRVIIEARVDAKLGHPEAAANSLIALGTPRADEVRASILEDADDWPGAEKALAAYAAKTIPASGPINDTQRRTLLHLATAAAQAGDNATLATLRIHDTTRMEAGPLADLFALLTAEPIQNISDLGRAARDAVIAGRLTSDLQIVHPLGHQVPP